MKFNKSLLLSSLIAASIVLFACNDKDSSKEKAEVKQEQPAQIQTEKESSSKDNVNLDRFNESVKITPIQRAIVKDKQGIEGAATVYEIENLSDKAIAAIHWLSIYNVGEKPIYLGDISISFDKPIQPKSKEVVTDITAIPNIAEQNRSLVLDLNNVILVKISALELAFTDGSKIIVNSSF